MGLFERMNFVGEGKFFLDGKEFGRDAWAKETYSGGKSWKDLVGCVDSAKRKRLGREGWQRRVRRERLSSLKRRRKPRTPLNGDSTNS